MVWRGFGGGLEGGVGARFGGGLEGGVWSGLHFGAPWRPFESTRLPNDRPELNFDYMLDSFRDLFGCQN